MHTFIFRDICTSLFSIISMWNLAFRIYAEEGTFNDVVFGDDITLLCGESCDNMQDISTLEWKKNDKPLSECGVTGRQSGGDLSSPSLTIQQLEMCDIANYTCCCSSQKSKNCIQQSVGVVVFRGASGSLGGSNNMYNLWASQQSANSEDNQTKRIGSMSGQHYKSDLVERWNDLYIDKIKLAVHKNGKQRAYFIFNGRDTTKLSWMTKDRLISTSYKDIESVMAKPAASGYRFTMGDFDYGYVRRRFFMNEMKNSCYDMRGWLAVVEKGHCDWEKKFQYPSIFFSSGDTSVNWQNGETADELTISLVAKEKMNEVTTKNAETSTNCPCSCRNTDTATRDFWASLNGKYTQSELKQIMQPMLRKLKAELTINKSKLSSYKRKRYSASDNRESSQNIGIVGALCISLVLAIIVLIDVIEIKQRITDIRYILGQV